MHYKSMKLLINLNEYKIVLIKTAGKIWSIYIRNNRKRFSNTNKYADVSRLYVLVKNHKVMKKFVKRILKIKIFCLKFYFEKYYLIS